MPAPVFHPRGHTAESGLFARILDRIDNDLPDCVGLAVSVHGKNDEHSILAAKGVGGNSSRLSWPVPEDRWRMPSNTRCRC